MVQPNFEQYIKYSALARNIYGRYTDQIEPYVSHKRGFRMLFDLLSNCKLGQDLRCYIGPKPSLNIRILIRVFKEEGLNAFFCRQKGSK